MGDLSGPISSQETPRSKGNSYMMKSQYTLQKVLNSTGASQNKFLNRSQSMTRMRVLENNRRGRSIDRITEAQLRPVRPETKSIYQHDYTHKSTSRERDDLQASRLLGDRRNLKHYRSSSELRGSRIDWRDENTNRSIDYNPIESPEKRLRTE